ncbi:MAG: rRNA pseudouridine synthase [Oscillospiraceae bacterium]|jgi:23S rRNA pseudouridine2605 synthase|nr:rRNA pseudouridine synthase [Oscillospiraceae bacterium]
MEERVQKLMAAAGLCSRRTAEEYLRQGRVTVNGQTAHLGDRADLDQDTISVDGVPLHRQEERTYILLHKPRGYACTLSDPHAAHIVTELLTGCPARVYPVGRLDVDSEGLLLLTDDGALAQRLLHPSGGVEKRYHVTVSGLREDSLSRLQALRDLDGEPIRPVEVRVFENGPPPVIEFTLHEGKKRQIRRMCRRVGLSVRRLCRVSEGGLTLRGLPPGHWRNLTEAEIALLWGEEGHGNEV